MDMLVARSNNHLSRNVVVGSCLISGNWVRDQGEKAKGRTSVGRKVPSSRAFLDETLWLTTVGCDGLGQEAEGEVIGRNPVVVLGNLDSPAKLLRDCRNHAGHTT